jgi:DNA-binding transcriptional MocR family regulator
MLRIVSSPAGGLYFWCRLDPALDGRDVLEHALPNLVSFVPGDAFYADRAGVHEIRICFTTIHPARSEEFARRLAMSAEAAYGRRPVRAKLAAKA